MYYLKRLKDVVQIQIILSMEIQKVPLLFKCLLYKAKNISLFNKKYIQILKGLYTLAHL